MTLIALAVNWNRPLLALLMICATIIACVGLWAMTVIKGRFK